MDGDGVNGSATRMVGDHPEGVPRSDQGAAPERGVELVRRHRHEVEVARVVMRSHVDRSVRRELGRVDEDATAGGVDPLGQAVDRRHQPGDVGGARHGEQGDAPGVAPQLPIEVLFVERPVGAGPHVDGARPRPPRQVVGVVFEQRGEDDCAVVEGHGTGELVDRLGRVLGEHDDIAVRVGVDEPADDIPRRFVDPGAETGLVAGAPVNAGVEGEVPVDRVHHRHERGRRGGVVEVDVRHEPAAERRDALVDPDEVRAAVQHASNVRKRWSGAVAGFPETSP